MFNSAVSFITFIFIWRNSIVFLIIVNLILVIGIVAIIVTVDVNGIIIRNIWVMVRSIPIITTERIIEITIIIRTITVVMVILS